MAWRLKTGPVVHQISSAIKASMTNDQYYDFVWVDKGVWIKPSTLGMIRSKTDKLIHYTPDPGIVYHHSRKFQVDPVQTLALG